MKICLAYQSSGLSVPIYNKLYKEKDWAKIQAKWESGLTTVQLKWDHLYACRHTHTYIFKHIIHKYVVCTRIMYTYKNIYTHEYRLKHCHVHENVITQHYTPYIYVGFLFMYRKLGTLQPQTKL